MSSSVPQSSSSSTQSDSIRIPKIEWVKPIEIPAGEPMEIDWRDFDVLNPVRDQKECWGCWAFVAVVLAETIQKLKFPTEPLKLLSPQMLIDCVCENPPAEKIQPKTGCYSHSIEKAFEWMMQNDVHSEEDYPYIRQKNPCTPKPNPTYSLRIDGFKKIQGDDRDSIREVLKYHPVGAVVDLTSKFKALRDEIYDGPTIVSQNVLRHAVVIIGYGTDEKTKKNYWLIQSTWGEKEWGVQGVGKVNRDVKVDGRYLPSEEAEKDWFLLTSRIEEPSHFHFARTNLQSILWGFEHIINFHRTWMTCSFIAITSRTRRL